MGIPPSWHHTPEEQLKMLEIAFAFQNPLSSGF
jgi:hypothetical protein